MSSPLIQLFLKAPRPGLVKTRLAAAIGDDNALAVYHKLVAGQLSRLPDCWPVAIHFTPADAKAEFSGWLGNEHAFYAQVNGNLGERLSHAVKDAFGQGYERVFCIGADCPELDAALFLAAEEALNEADVVFGPALDGGYYLIGMKAHHKVLFEDIPWSTAETLAASLRAAESADLQVRLLPELRDIDTVTNLAYAIEEGLLVYRSALPEEPTLTTSQS